jgi:hypothetical protein
MATVFMQEQNRTGGKRAVSSQVSIVTNMTHIRLSLTSSNWESVGTGSVAWGVEASFDNGATWVTMGGASSRFGFLNKGTLLPSIGLSRLNKIAALWRIFVFPSANIRLGIQGDFDAWQSP